MDKQRTVVGVIVDVERLRNTADGGPVWKLGMRSGAIYKTKPGGTVGSALTGYEAGHHAVIELEHDGDGWVASEVKVGEPEPEPEPEVTVVSEHIFESWRDVSRLQPGYYEVRGPHSTQYAFTVDGIGCHWYDSRQDMFDGKASE